MLISWCVHKWKEPFSISGYVYTSIVIWGLLQGIEALCMEIRTVESPERAQVKWKAVKQYLENISIDLPESLKYQQGV